MENGYGYAIGPVNREKIRVIFSGLYRWFVRELTEGQIHYPNKHLGDLVCAWLLAEYFEDARMQKILAPKFDEAIGYWQSSHWGWGEHLSQVYTTVMLTELSVLLTLQQQLPRWLVGKLETLCNELLCIQDFFGNGPWTPTIRCYSFDEIPANQSYREQIRYWHPELDSEFLNALPEHRFMRACFAHFLHSHGWHNRFPINDHVEDTVMTIPCYEGVQATIWKKGDCRLGSLSRYPLNPAWDQPVWGLSWQSFPVAAAVVGKVWAFPQWQVTWQDGAERFHPARIKSDGYLRNALMPEGECGTGETIAVQDGPTCHIQRRMPKWHPFWQSLLDGWTIYSSETFEIECKHEGPIHYLRLRQASKVVLEITCRPPDGQKPTLIQLSQQNAYRWQLPIQNSTPHPTIDWNARFADYQAH